MSSIEIVVKYSRLIENILEEEFGAYGKGLHEKVNDVEEIIPIELAQSIRKIANIRTQIVYKDNFAIQNQIKFIRSSEKVIDALKEIDTEIIDDDEVISEEPPYKISVWKLLFFMLLSAAASITFLTDFFGIGQTDVLMTIVLAIVGGIGGGVIFQQSLNFLVEYEDEGLLPTLKMIYFFLSTLIGSIFGFNMAGIGGAIVGMLVGMSIGGIVFYTPAGVLLILIGGIALLWNVGK